jgi:DNA (cytosine-5)-methyltransferase 1
LDHRPLWLNKNDYERVMRIPYKKVGVWFFLVFDVWSIHLLLMTVLNYVIQGANFRDLEGVRVGPNNIVEFDPKIPRVYLKTGKPLVRVLWFYVF